MQFLLAAEIEGHHRSQLRYDDRTPRVVECTSDLMVALLNELVGGQIPSVGRSLRIRRYATDLGKDALAKALQRNLSQFPKGLPVRFREIGRHRL